MMEDLVQRARDNNARLNSIIDRVCGACDRSCCHQGTMMGSQDLRRLYKGLRLEPGREQVLREGLRKRGEELAVDLEAVKKVRNLIYAAVGEENKEYIERLDDRIRAWQEFCDKLSGDIDLSMEGLMQLLHFSAIRANCLKAIRQLEGAQAALVTLSQGKASFRLSGGRRIAAPRCLFHYDGCLAGRWKPAKCANFFCTGTPNVLQEIAREMSFDDFVLGNCTVLPSDKVMEAIRLELELGREFVEPKIVVGLSAEYRQQLIDLITAQFDRVIRDDSESLFMWSTTEARNLLGALADDEAMVATHHSAGGPALYELAVALDGLRVIGTPPAFYLFLDTITSHSPLAHPLWDDKMMTQPLGALDLYVVES